MKEFFEPMLFLSTPDHPNTMGAVAVLKEEVDGEILRDVVGGWHGRKFCVGDFRQRSRTAL